ncbi:MAG: LuxR C-terminal-related transcriptional regulator [Oscillospiraceae bacterium]|nr:LuxR C-terminal-related transcriptional regulator [Oscillospiraceae bacterium]
MNKSFFSNIENLHKSNIFLERTRLWKTLETAADYPLIAVYAGSGYGKTRSVYSFLQEYGAATIWMQLTERDNILTHFWENYVHMVSMSWPEAAAQLREIGIPDSEETFAKYTTVRENALKDHKKCFFVYDNFHLLNNPDILHIIEKIANSVPSNETVIIISRTMPEVNMTGLMLRERIFTIREDTLCFTEDEIAEYFKQLELDVARQDIRDIYDETKGWVFAVSLIGRSMGKDVKYERYTLEAMKKNVFKLIEAEISNIISEPLRRFLLRISLIDRLAAGLIKTLAGNETLIREMECLNAYIRYDYHLGVYMIHHLFLETLRQKQDLLTDGEKRKTYQTAAEWCEQNGYQTDALSYYNKAENWDAILRIIYIFNFPIPQDIADYVLKIFDEVPEELLSQNPLFPTVTIKLNMSLGLMAEANSLAERYVQEYEARPETPENNRALANIYGSWGMLQVINGNHTDGYHFDTCFEKQRFYHDKSPEKAYNLMTNTVVGSYALLVGTNRAGVPEEYIETMSRSIPHISHVFNGGFYGLDDLARGELFYFRRDFNTAEQHLNRALEKSREKDQYDIQNRSMLYLMLISLTRGNMKNADELFKSMEELLDIKEYTVRYESYDIARSHFYIALGCPELIPGWLKSDFSNYAHPSFWENIANRIKAHYRYLTRQYNVLLTFLENIPENRTMLLGRIVFKILEALTLYKLKRQNEAIQILTVAYRLAEPNRFITPFAQYAKDMRTLTAAALRNDSCEIPHAWLEDINRKSSAFAKRQKYLITEYMAANHIEERIHLTSRETEILRDLSQGLSRTEIAASRNISVSTVKVAINIIYEKLHANSLADAVRIAKDIKII